ncbi:hypothetical protein AAMO2058_001451600 [Amorphochlora amoebiformis]
MAAIVHLQSKFSKWNPVETRRAAFQKTLNTLIKKPVFLDFKPVLRFLEVTGIKQNYNNSKSQNTQAHEWRLRYEDRSPLVYFLKALLPQSGSRVSIGLLYVKVVSARDIPKVDFLGIADPYCKLNLGTIDKRGVQTKWKYNTSRPHWGEEFHIKVTNATSVLRVSIWDHDNVSNDECIGYCYIPLSELNHEQKVLGDFKLQRYIKEDDKKGKDKIDDTAKNIWKTKPPTVTLELKYTYSKMGELASFLHPEPKPYTYGKFDINVLYANLMELLTNIQPILDFFYDVHLTISWKDPYWSFQVLVVFILTCYHPWLLLVIIQLWLLRYMLIKFLENEAKEEESYVEVHDAHDDGTPIADEEEVSLGVAARPLQAFIGASGYERTLATVQNRLFDANATLNTLYGLFDWHTPAITVTIFKVICGTTLYCIMLPNHYLILLVGCYILLMYTLVYKITVGTIAFIQHRLNAKGFPHDEDDPGENSEPGSRQVPRACQEGKMSVTFDEKVNVDGVFHEEKQSILGSENISQSKRGQEPPSPKNSPVGHSPKEGFFTGIRKRLSGKP